MHLSLRLVSLALCIAPLASAGNNSTPLVQACTGYSFPRVACMYRYASKMPLDFYRKASTDMSSVDTYTSTEVPNDDSFQQVGKATFLVWDQQRGSEILGSDPVYDIMFTVSTGGHEAPVYVPDTNEVWFSELGTGELHQKVISLDGDSPTLSTILTDPPMYAPSGARYRNGKIYFSVGGGNSTLEGGPYHPGIYSVDPKTRKSTIEVNNYFGWYFNQANDMDIDQHGRIWFSDPFLARNFGTSTVAPQVQASVYRYDPETGEVKVVDDTLHCPNGVAFSPDYKTLYLTDTDAGVTMIDPKVPLNEVPSLQYNSTNRRTVYAFDVSEDGSYLKNRRPIYTAKDFVPDGLKVASNGYVITGAGHGVDILDTTGTPLVSIQTNFTAVNTVFGGKNLDELWIVGHGAVARAKLNLTGPALQ
ncbi:lactonohydrolase [Aspergillus bombycis]|uniref:Lactonohydrolase n=1 Tax=Aspergillus bombycis TaxID=109264 RepID=A0A1F7ZRZ2_9EURO|nr:lactonohydrolase [Aspergillus bombycis]OGM42216.1 lactonohydrolase [Aspergillus bombycis]